MVTGTPDDVGWIEGKNPPYKGKVESGKVNVRFDGPGVRMPRVHDCMDAEGRATHGSTPVMRSKK